jgi:16S rRNA C1402 N4-methylase RsmH
MFKRLKTTSELAYLIESVLDTEKRLDKLARPTHTATKSFQGIRIFVNNEMNELNQAMEIAHEILIPNGKLVVLTFHSLEVSQIN